MKNEYINIKNKLNIINKISIELKKEIIEIENNKKIKIKENKEILPAGIKYIHNNTHIHFINSLRN